MLHTEVPRFQYERLNTVTYTHTHTNETVKNIACVMCHVSCVPMASSSPSSSPRVPAATKDIIIACVQDTSDIILAASSPACPPRTNTVLTALAQTIAAHGSFPVPPREWLDRLLTAVCHEPTVHCCTWIPKVTGTSGRCTSPVQELTQRASQSTHPKSAASYELLVVTHPQTHLPIGLCMKAPPRQRSPITTTDTLVRVVPLLVACRKTLPAATPARIAPSVDPCTLLRLPGVSAAVLLTVVSNGGGGE